MALSFCGFCDRLKMKSVKWQNFLLLVLMLSQAAGVSRDNFKSCDQSGFCKRHRAMEKGKSPYIVLMDSINIQSTNIEVQLLNKINNVKLLLQVFALTPNTARIRINELQADSSRRFEIPVGDVLIGEPKQQSLSILDKSSDSITVGFEKNKVVISKEPFRIDFITDEEPVITVNSQGLLKFEHYRKKAGWLSRLGSAVKSWFSSSEVPEPPAEHHQEPLEDDGEKEEEIKEDEPEPEPEKKEEEEPGLWEETFKSFTDSKPHGPMSVGMDVSFPGFENVYGIPEHADSFALKTTASTDPYRLFNLDVFEYDLYNPMALYGSVPFMLAHNEQRTVGIFWHNAAEAWIDIRSNVADKNFLSKMADLVKGSTDIPQTDTQWMFESGVLDLFVMLGPRPADVFYQYAQLTGTTNLPPLFSIAYHQCRWNYNDEEDVANVEANLDKVDIPFDVIWLDIEHTDGKRYFTWAGDKFPHSDEMVNKLAAKGRKMVTIVDPHLKRDDNYGVYTDAKNKDFMVKNKDGGEYEGWCWPGSSSWPDFLNPEVRKWWASKFAYSEYKGSTPDLFTWNDMNEPSVFNGPEITFHKDVVHFGGYENRDIHNLYGMYVQQATAEGQIMRSGNQERPFVLTRAFFAGSQRYGAVWTGDNMGEWSHLKAANPMLLSLSVTGITFCGADVGGFFKNPEPELIARWYQAGAYQPFFRAHAHLDTRRREPYLLDEAYMKVTRDAIRARYSFLPLWYTLFYQGEKLGMPVMRPLWVEFPEDTSTFKIDDEYLIGSALLVKPITEAGMTGTSVYFPGKDRIWYDIQNYQSYNGGQTLYIPAPLNKIPVFQQSGTIVPRKLRIRRSSTLMYNDPYTLIVCLGAQGEASGHLYTDDYHSFGYRQGKFVYREFTFSDNTLRSKSADPSGKYDTKEWIERIVIVGLQREPNETFLRTKDGQYTLQHVYNKSLKLLIVRKPGINVQEDFAVELQ